MPQTGRPRLRVHAALLAVCYASLLLAVTVPHDIFGCGHAPRPHCSACASLQSVPILAEPDHLQPQFAVGRSVIFEPLGMFTILRAADTGTRAPPSPGH